MGGAVETKMTVGQTVGQNGEDRSALEALIIGHSPAVVQLREMIRRVARSNASVMLCGPSGSGKELVARAIHDEGVRSGRAFSAINCGAIPADLIESELFGHEKGSFTGAHARRIGHFEASEGGTLFLDEIGDMRFDMQVKLLRVLEDGLIQRVGGGAPIASNVRIISATHQNIDVAIDENRFREDLYYRLNVLQIHLPALRDRLMPAIQRLGSGTDYILMAGKKDPNLALVVAQPYLNLCGTIIAGWLLAKEALAASKRLAAGDGDGTGIAAGFDAVGNDGMVGSTQRVNSGDGQHRRIDAFDLGSHLDQ